MAKLTAAQTEVLELMASGADLYGPSDDGRWIWSGASAYKPPRAATCDKLIRSGLIELDRRRYPVGHYRLTNAGRQAAALLGIELPARSDTEEISNA